MQISVWQFQPRSGDRAGNLARIGVAARAAAAAGSTLLVTPELSVTGYAGLSDMAAWAEPRGGESCRAVQEIAETFAIAIAVGYPERAGGEVYNTALMVQPGREPVHYRKCHLYGPDEKRAFRPSNVLPAPFDLGGIKAALLICYDVEFPEMVRAAAVAGAELIVVPTAQAKCDAGRVISEVLVPARAMENHVFVAYADLCGEERGLVYQGGSVIVAPDGEVLARAGGAEALLTVTLDPGVYRRRALDPYLTDRRPDLYAAWSRSKA